MFTVLCRVDNATIWYPNAKLYSEPMINLSKSKNKWEKLLVRVFDAASYSRGWPPPPHQLLVDLATPFAALLDRLNTALPAFFKTLPTEFSGAYTLVLRDVKDPLKGQVAVFYEFAHCGRHRVRAYIQHQL